MLSGPTPDRSDDRSRVYFYARSQLSKAAYRDGTIVSLLNSYPATVDRGSFRAQ